MRNLLEEQIIKDAKAGDTTVLAELLELLGDKVIFGALSDYNQERASYKPYGISTSDGHDEEWTYYDSEVEAHETFIYMQGYETDIHLFKLTDKYEYEVIDSWSDDTE